MTEFSVPWDQVAEQSVLGALLLDNSAFDRVGSLQEVHFYDSRHRAIFRAAARLIQADRPADTVTVRATLETESDPPDLSYLEALTTCVPSAANVRRYAEIVRDRAARRALISTADEALGVA